MASFLVADEAFVVLHVLHSLTRREIDFVHIHGIGIGTRSSAGWQDLAISSSSELPKLYHVAVKFSSLVEPLFPFPTSLFLTVRKGCGSHHNGKLLSYSSLEGVYEDAVIIDSAACLGQFEGHGVLIKVSIELVHAERIDGLAGLVLNIFRDEGFLKGFA